MSSARHVARRLVEAQSTAAMLTTFNEADMSAVMALRERHKQAFKERHGVGLGVASFFVKASIGALRAFPRINAEIQGDEMVLKRYYDIGVAVGASEGLVVPVLRDADRMSFAEIEQRIRDFAKRAGDGTLSLADRRADVHDHQRRRLVASEHADPQSAAGRDPACTRSSSAPWPSTARSSSADDAWRFTYDHGIVDGAEAVQFLVRVKQLVEDPRAALGLAAHRHRPAAFLQHAICPA